LGEFTFVTRRASRIDTALAANPMIDKAPIPSW
jgi:hypothetical protein